MDQYRNHPLYGKHNLDTVMSSLWGFYKNNFLSLFLISLVMSGIIQYASTMINLSELQSATDPSVMLEKVREMIGPIMIVALISIFLTTILQHFIINRPVETSNTIFVSLLKSFRYFVPFLVILVLLSFFAAIAITIGVLALIIGAFFAALYIFAIFLFILPVMMVEGAGIGNTIGRTFSLLHRSFWTNIGWVAVFTIILIVINVVLSGIIMIPFSGGMLKSILNPEAVRPDFMANPVFIILSAVVSAITLPLTPIFACILYFNAKAGEDEITVNAVQQPTEYIPRVEDLYSRPLDENKDSEQEENSKSE